MDKFYENQVIVLHDHDLYWENSNIKKPPSEITNGIF